MTGFHENRYYQFLLAVAGHGVDRLPINPVDDHTH